MPSLPATVELPAAVWRGSDLAAPVQPACSTGWAELDRELAGGWPARCLTEVLSAQPLVLELRLLAPALRWACHAGRQVVFVGPPRAPHLPGLVREGLHPDRVVWIAAEQPAERLWAVEQLVRSNAAGAMLAWLPQARPEQIRRLQVACEGCEAPVFLWRPESARHEASAAPLRVHASARPDWELLVTLLKRRGPARDASLRLRSVPGGLQDILTPRLERPSLLGPQLEPGHVVGGPASESLALADAQQ